MARRRVSKLASAAVATGMLTIAIAEAQQPRLPPAENTDPVQLGLMQGFPPAPEKIVTLQSVLKFPNNRWGWHNIRQLGPTAAVWRGRGGPSLLPAAPIELDSVSFEDESGARTTIADWQKTTLTDAILILDRGRVAYERYHVGMRPEQPHALWSVTKSVTGLLATLLVHEGKIEPGAKVSAYLPELADTAWGDASVQQVMDMTSGVRYREAFAPSAETGTLLLYLFSNGLVPAPANYPGPKTMFKYLETLQKDGEHGKVFSYKSVDTEVLGWIVRRVSGKRLSELLSERVWSQIGAEEDAYIWVDQTGSEVTAIGLNATLRDVARFGEMLRLGGSVNGKRVLPQAVVDEIRKGGDRDKFRIGDGTPPRTGYSFHNQWWIAHDPDGSFEAHGLNGQHLHINPAAELVVVKFSSHSSETRVTHALDRRAYAALAAALRNRPR